MTAATDGPAALVLMGGGARAAYQVGALAGIRQVLRDGGLPPERNPFRIVCGTSAGAINATALASHADDFSGSIGRLLAMWEQITAAQIYRTDAPGSLLNASRWIGSLAFGWLARHSPRSLFDNSPLARTLDAAIDFAALRRMIADGTVDALAITASSYTSGQHVTFFESARRVVPWFRSQRMSQPMRIDTRHLMASSAIPFVFPAVPLPLGDHQEFFGDGSMRQNAPLSPAIHLGATRLLVIGAGQIAQGADVPQWIDSQFEYPALAQIAGHAMATIFLDALANDVERTTRVNHTLSLIAPDLRAQSGLRPIDVLAITPTQRLDLLALPHMHELPPAVRGLLNILGANDRHGSALMSYLLFEQGYVGELLALGRADAMARGDDILALLQPGR